MSIIAALVALGIVGDKKAKEEVAESFEKEQSEYGKD